MNTLAWCLLAFCAGLATAIPRSLLYDVKLSKTLPRGDDVSSTEIRLKIPIMFYGTSYQTLYINTNGLISFNTDIPIFFNIEFPLDFPIIAPLYSNIDTTGNGDIFYFETADRDYLDRADITIWDAFPEASSFRTKSVFIVSWMDVGYHRNGTDKLNTFQVAIYSNGHDSYVEFLYVDNGIQWIQGVEQPGARPDARAQAGFTSMDGRFYNLPGSGSDQVVYLDRRSNMNLPGQWLFRVGDIGEEAGIEVPKAHNSKSVENYEPTTCATAETYCHMQAKCIDYEAGFCCHCKKGYYGNGKTCIKKDVPLRVNGKVNLKINEEEVNNLDLQSYVVMTDARAYTAMSKIPTTIGADIQAVQIMGATIAFLFAKPVGESLNGFQLNGGIFNHSATIEFPNTDQKVTIRQKYLGLDAFGQLKLEADIAGELPALPEDAQVSIEEYQEQYTITAAGIIQSSSSHKYSYEHLGEEIEVPYKISQNFIYEYCTAKTIPVGTTWKLRVGKNFIGYEAREQIVRFGMSNKIGPLGDIDPCEKGRETCGPHSSCVVEDDTFHCVCNPGYQTLYVNNEETCEDINECTYGIHDCDYNAQCINIEGAFMCSCNPGFEGNGRICENARSCDTVQCNNNAECVVHSSIARCQCLPGFQGNGYTCTPLLSQSCHIANNCSPYGYCAIDPEDNMYSCHCLPQYEGNGYECTPSPTEATPITEPPQTEQPTTNIPSDYIEEKCFNFTCWCPNGFTKDSLTGFCAPQTNRPKEDAQSGVLSAPEVECFNGTLCFCPFGYKLSDQSCIPLKHLLTMGVSGSKHSCNVLHNCDRYAQCLFTKTGYYECACNPGFVGDGYKCKEIKEQCNDEDCDINASCAYDQYFDRPVCKCKEGYQGDGLTCSTVPRCKSNIDCYENEECRFSSNVDEYDCVCKTGYTKDSQAQCVRAEGLCGGARCVENAECAYDNIEMVNYCQCTHGFDGDGIISCARRPVTCDIENNCGLHATCDYIAGSYQCRCDEGFVGDGIVCYVEQTCHVDPSLCDRNARCITNAQRKYSCECNPGFDGNGTVCYERLRHEGNFLVVNQGIATLKLSYDPNKEKGKPIHMRFTQLAVGLDVDCVGGRIYWTDITQHAIRSVSYNGSEKEDFITRNIGSPEGLAMDWISRNLYWTDSKKDTIEVANVQTKLRKVLIDTNLVNPRGIAVHPQRGKIFWSDWNRADPKIEWANQDGTGREVFLKGIDYVGLPNSLTVDYANEQLCYADAGVKKIICIDIDGRLPHVIAENCTYPFGIAVTSEHIYWSDWVSRKIERVEKVSLKRLKPLEVPLVGTGNKLYELVSVPDDCPNLTNVCYYYKDQCLPNHICLPDGKNSRSCVCADKIDSNQSSSSCDTSNNIE